MLPTNGCHSSLGATVWIAGHMMPRDPNRFFCHANFYKKKISAALLSLHPLHAVALAHFCQLWVSLIISLHPSLLRPGLLRSLHQPPERQIVVGICAMTKKSKSKPMTQILERLCKFDYITVVIFPEEVILEEPVEKWPLCDCLISFHSKGKT